MVEVLIFKLFLTLGKLALLAGALETELLAFFLAWVTAEEVGFLEGAAQVFVKDNESLSNP